MQTSTPGPQHGTGAPTESPLSPHPRSPANTLSPASASDNVMVTGKVKKNCPRRTSGEAKAESPGTLLQFPAKQEGLWSSHCKSDHIYAHFHCQSREVFAG